MRQYEEVNAEQLQRLLNDGILRGLSPKTGGFSVKVSDDMLNLLALRYGGSSGHITLSSFICLILRLDAMAMDVPQHVLLSLKTCSSISDSSWN
ncbi:hypothetical protein JZ751_022068 [Albula glossodonta]|uniref:Calpain-3/13-like C-terminal EF-hand domain-containing protein n=1 Tax=Albula glossodonta TaxID=121402 RepID=A0A8T2MRS0_9TELE|nr:hypothetical protein JZ751_016665 [Albula glossodonta]KAG9330788.1 hypothetical protein JZ751_022068 [Albula glossodonta]